MLINAFQKNVTGPELDATMPPTYSSTVTKFRCSYLRMLLKIHYYTASSILSKDIWKQGLKILALIFCGCIYNSSNYTSKNLEWIELTHSIRVLLDAGSARPPPLAFRAPEPDRHSLPCEASQHWCIPNNTGIACTATTISKRRSGGAGDRKYERRWQQDYTTPGHRHCTNSCHKCTSARFRNEEIGASRNKVTWKWVQYSDEVLGVGGEQGRNVGSREPHEDWEDLDEMYSLELFIQCGIAYT